MGESERKHGKWDGSDATRVGRTQGNHIVEFMWTLYCEYNASLWRKRWNMRNDGEKTNKGSHYCGVCDATFLHLKHLRKAIEWSDACVRMAKRTCCDRCDTELGWWDAVGWRKDAQNVHMTSRTWKNGGNMRWKWVWVMKCDNCEFFQVKKEYWTHGFRKTQWIFHYFQLRKIRHMLFHQSPARQTNGCGFAKSHSPQRIIHRGFKEWQSWKGLYGFPMGRNVVAKKRNQIASKGKMICEHSKVKSVFNFVNHTITFWYILFFQPRTNVCDGVCAIICLFFFFWEKHQMIQHKRWVFITTRGILWWKTWQTRTVFFFFVNSFSHKVET